MVEAAWMSLGSQSEQQMPANMHPQVTLFLHLPWCSLLIGIRRLIKTERASFGSDSSIESLFLSGRHGIYPGQGDNPHRSPTFILLLLAISRESVEASW